jgi:glycosyltransferase involved in cell wall biosynthesis
MKDILLVSAIGDITDKRNFRLSKVYSALSEHKRNFITSDFDHWSKEYKDLKNLPSGTYIHVPAYKKSLSIQRLISYIVFAIKLKNKLECLKNKPDVIYCIMPTSSSAYICGKYCKKNNIKFIIDIIDLWPESLFPISKYEKIFNCLCYPWRKISKRAYQYADVICAESEKYMKVASLYNPEALSNYTYLGVDPQKIEKLISKSDIKMDKPEDELWVCYGGHLGRSYDFVEIIKGLVYIQNRNIKYKFFFVGDGEKRKQIENLSSKHNLNVIITGILPYYDYLKYLSLCDIAINIFKKDTKVVHSFKFNDYAAINLFILNSLPGETANMISKYQIGLNFNFEDNPLSTILYEACSNWNFYKEWKQNNIQLIIDCLDQNVIYKKMTSLF